MRAALLAAVAAVAFLPAPALAQAAVPYQSHHIARELSDPGRQAQAQATTEAVAGAVLDTPVAPLLRATRELEGQDPNVVDPNLRLGDLLPPDAANAPHEFARQLPRTMNALADMSAAIGDLSARLAALGQAAHEASDTYRR